LQRGPPVLHKRGSRRSSVPIGTKLDRMGTAD